MRYKVYIDYTSGDVNNPEFIEIFPWKLEPLSINRAQSTKIDEITQYFYRVDFGDISLKNDPHLWAATAQECYRMYDRIQLLAFSQLIIVKVETTLFSATGYLGRNDCEFDHDRKIVTLKPSTLDRYTYLFENWEEDVRLKNIDWNNGRVDIVISNSYLVTKVDWPWEFHLCKFNPLNGDFVYDEVETGTPRNRVKEKHFNDYGLYTYFDGAKPKQSLFSDTYWRFEGIHDILSTEDRFDHAVYDLNDRIAILGEEGSDQLIDEYGDWELSRFRVYKGKRTGGLSGKRWRNLYCRTWFSRDEVIKIDVYDEEGILEKPPGEGWNKRSEKLKEGQPAHLWTRKPFNGAYSDVEDWILSDIVENPGGSSEGFSWYTYLETQLNYDTTQESISLYTSMDLRSYLEYVLQNSAPELAGMPIVSTFFWNDYEEELEILKNTVGFNYVSGYANHLNGLMVVPTYMMKKRADDEEVKHPKYNFKETLDDLNSFFFNNLCFFITDAGELRIEHIRYMDLVREILNITNSKYISYTAQWDYDKSMMYEKYDITHVNSAYDDFTDNTVEFDNIVSNSRNRKSIAAIKTEIFSSDMRFAVYNPNDLDDGFILVTATTRQEAVWPSMNVIDIHTVEPYNCPVTNTDQPNGRMAISNVLLDFCRYEGIWHYGVINGSEYDFKVTQRNKLGIELTLDGKKISMFYVTQIGVGILEKCTFDPEFENTKVVIRYRYNSSVNGDTFAVVYQKEQDFEGAQNIWADIDNYTVN